MAWSKLSKETSTNMEDTNPTKTSKLSKKTIVITWLVLGLILTQTIILAKVTLLADIDSALETKLSDLKSEVDELKAMVRLNIFLLSACLDLAIHVFSDCSCWL